ncbi:hypothetical protein [Microbulbifer celer]|uniref:Lipoprotein n=1 Tax=Microbulbifer celer TaxID=435905 RepID=A0ABW3U938_9GAMM|nr:hypothetical protein [Microbulbifer celer]UFN57257.1 hypothetical protein LPW13_17075 [Microbulbifer celer]
MKRVFGGVAAVTGAALLTLSGCSSMEDMTDTTTATNLNKDRPGYYSVQGRYYHCHRNGHCHNVRHPSYYRHDAVYRRSYIDRRGPQQPR